MSKENDQQQAWVKAGELSLEQRKIYPHHADNRLPVAPYIMIEYIGVAGRLFQVNMEKAGYETTIFYSAAEAIAKMRVVQPGLILCYEDHGEGLKLLEEKSAIRELRDVPAIFIACYGKDKGSDFPRALELGAYACFSVPVEPKELVKIARSVVR